MPLIIIQRAPPDGPSKLNHTLPARDLLVTSTHRTNLAVFMIAFESTGYFKAAFLTHGRVLASLEQKRRHHKSGPESVFLNWRYPIMSQVSWRSIFMESVREPLSLISRQRLHRRKLQFIQIISKHRVIYTFAPNIFLASLVQTFEQFFRDQHYGEHPLLEEFLQNQSHQTKVIDQVAPKIILSTGSRCQKAGLRKQF